MQNTFTRNPCGTIRNCTGGQQPHFPDVQKRRIKQQYAKAARQAGQAAAQGAAATAENGFRVTKLASEGGERVAEFAARNWKTILIVAVFGLLALLLITGLQSCTVMAGTAGTGVTASSYFSKDKDMLGAEKAYAKLEQKLQRYLDTYEATHNYDEYHFYLDEIEHDPYVLISICPRSMMAFLHWPMCRANLKCSLKSNTS